MYKKSLRQLFFDPLADEKRGELISRAHLLRTTPTQIYYAKNYRKKGYALI